jgi:HEAT repeat protein
VQPLIELLQCGDPNYSLIWVIHALGKLGDRQAVRPLVALLHATQSIPERYTVIEALGKLGDPSVVDDIRVYMNDSDHHVRDRVMGALACLSVAGKGASANSAD